MKAKTCLALAIAAGCASVASAGPDIQTSTNFQSLRADQIGYIYVNVATGEVVRTDAQSMRGTDDSAPVWINEMYLQCTDIAEWYYTPIRDAATGEDTWWVDWGDIAPNSVIDAINFLYATDVADPEEDGEEGFEMDVSFFDGVDIGQITSALTPYLVYTFTGIPGSASGVVGWLVTFDLAGGGEFEIGDTDGIDDSGNGFFSGGAGADIDSVPGADFAYGFNFRLPAELASGVIGCGLVAPPEGVVPNSLGTDDVMGLYTGAWNILDGLYWFGGYDCSPGAGAWTPWADYYIGLYGPDGGGNDCEADISGDGAGDDVLDFNDVLQFLTWFSSGDMRADFASDGVLDVFDVIEYLGLFSAGCP